MEDRDFIDFEFNGHWASEFNLLAVSNGDRYSNSFYGSVNPNTVEMVGKTGVYKWKTQIGEKRFSINIAYDDIDLGTLRKIKEWLNPFVISKLTFKEEPYKYYWVSLADDPEISFLPFRTDDVVVDGKSYKKGVFKGDVTLNFICADNFGYSDWQSFDEDYDYLVEEISDVSNFSFDNGSDNNLIITEIKGNSVQDVVKPVAYTHVEGKNLGLKSQYKDIRNLKVLGASQQEQRPLSQKQASGEQVKLVDVDPNKFIDIFVNGNSYQETTQGYNFLNVSSSFTVTSSQNNRIVPISLKANTTYTIQADEIDTDSTVTSPNFLFRFRYNNEDVGNIRMLLRTKKISFTTISNVDTVWIYSGTNYNESATTNTTYTNLIIYEGTAEKSYEPYTGGAPSPNPDYPQDIEVVDGCNRFDKNDITANAMLDVDTGEVVGASSTLCVSNFIPVEADKPVYLSDRGTSRTALYDKNKKFLNKPSKEGGKTVITPIQDGYIRMTINLSSVNIDEVQLTEGTEEKPYLPHGCVGMKFRGKQLLYNTAIPRTKFGVTVSYIESEDVYLINGTAEADGDIDFLNLNESLDTINENESFSAGIKQVGGTLTGKIRLAMAIQYADNTFSWAPNPTIDSQNQNENTERTKAEKSGKIVRPRMYIYKDAIYDNLKVKLSVMKGSTITYEPYHEPKLIPINLNGNSLAKVGDIKDKLIIHRNGEVELEKKVRKYVFTGEELWNQSSYGEKSWILPVSYVSAEKTNSTINVISNIFNGVSSDDRSKELKNKIYTDNSSGAIVIRDTQLTTLEDVRVATKDNYIYYKLITPQTIKLPSIEPIELWEGTVNIEIVGNLPVNMDINYNILPAMPSPDAPSQIQNAGDNINLLNKDIVDASNNLRGNALDTGRRLIANKDRNYTYGVFKLGGRELLGKTLGIHADIETTGGNPRISIFAGSSSSLTKSLLGVALSTSGTGYITLPSSLSDELDTISAVLYVTTDTSVVAGTYVDYTNLKVQVGSKEVVYSAYNRGSLGITIRNENFGDAELLYSQMKNFSSSNVRKELVDNKNCIVFLNTQFRDAKGFKGLKFNYKKDTQYVIRGKFRIYDTSITSGSDLWMEAYDKDGKEIGHNNYQARGSEWIQFSFLTDINSSFDHIDFSYGTTAYWCLDMDSLEIYEGTSVREVPKSQVQTVTFPLEEGQKLYEGSYLAADGIHNTRTQIKLLRSSGGFFVSALGNYQVFGKTKKGVKQGSRLLSNYFKDYGSVSAIKYTVGIANNNSADRIYVSNGISTTLDEFEDWLDKCENAGRPVIVEYELAKEEIIPYTTTQRQIYDKLKTLTVKDGYIHLSVDGLGSISLDYNGYDGSPSPAYPSKIRTVGSNINLFDKDNYTELSLQLTPATKTLNTSRNERGTYFKCKPNTIYSFQKSTNGTVYLRGNVCETQVVPTDGCSYDNYVSFQLENKISYKTSATAKYIYFNFYCITSDISKQELLNSIKIEEEPENTALSAYNKANVETKIENANYYNPANGFNYGVGAANTTTVNTDGTITTTSNYSNSRGKGTPVYLKKNTNYYLSLELVSLTVSAGDEKHIAAEIIGYNKFGGGANIVSQIFNIRQTEIGTRWVGQFNSGDCDRWALHISGWFGSSNKGTATYKNVMISEQNIDYVPNETQTVTMPIQQELLTGDYIKDTEHHEWGKLVVTGQENWNQYNRSLTDGYFGAFLAKDDVKNTGIVICNKLPQEGGAVYNTTGYGVANFMEGYLYICLRREDFGASDITSLADCTTLLKAYLAKCYADGDPFIIYYKVKKPVDLELTQEQKNTQNFAKNFVFSYPGTNRVYADNDVVKLSASYVPEQNINIDFMVEGSNLLDSSAFYYQNDIFLKAFEDKESGDATKSGISEERPVYLYNAGNKDAALKLDFDLIIPAENSPLTIQIEKGKMTENGFSKISDYSQIAINNFEHYRPFVDIFDGHLENWQIEIDSNLCEVYVKHKIDKTKIISLNKFNENQSFLSLAGSEIVDYAKAFPTSLEEIKNSAIEDTIFNKVTIAPCAQNYRLKNVSLDWKHTYL